MAQILSAARPRAVARWKRRPTLGQGAIVAALLLIFFVTAYPFFFILSFAVMPYKNYVSQPIHALPSGFTLLYFQQLLNTPQLTHAFEISALKTGVGTILNVLATAMAGYALSRKELRFGRILTVLFLIPLFVGGGLIPYFLVVRATGLLNTFGALVIPGLVAPFYLFVARAFFLEYPREVIEAAHVDGAGHFTIFWRIIWPTSVPILATMAMLYGINHWNEYFWPSFLVQQDLYPATVVLQALITNRDMLAGLGLNQQVASASFVAAMAAVMIIPVLIVYPFLQRYVVRGILLGSLKG